MNVLIIKLGATGDVVRTTPLMRRFNGNITWVTAATNTGLLESLQDNVRPFSWEERERALDRHYDLAIIMEDTLDVAQFLTAVTRGEIFDAYADSDNSLRNTENTRRWIDLSVVSSF